VLKSFLRSFAVASVLSLSVGAADAVTVSYQKAGDPFNGNGKAGVTVTSVSDPVKPEGVGAMAGGFFLKGDIFGKGVENFVGWCLDITHYLADGGQYSPTNVPFAQDKLTVPQVADIQRLFNTAYAGLDFKSNAQSAGFQLALWEIIYEKRGDNFDLDLGLGNLTITGNAAAIAAGQAFLDKLGGTVTQHWNLTFLESEKNQDLVTATPVPVPAAAGLLLLALGGLAVAGRRRRTD
jgi:hypothetical protein